MVNNFSYFNQFTPICFLFPGWFPNDIKLVKQVISTLEPSAVGIYTGGSEKLKILLKNIETIRKCYPEKPLFAVSVYNPKNIELFIKSGADHFVVNNWAMTGRGKPILDVELRSLVQDYEVVKKKCECESCNSPILQETLINNRERDVMNVNKAIHSACAYKELINILKKENN